MADARAAHRIVVGVDGTPGSARALAYAADLAERCGLTLDVVFAFGPPPPTPSAYLLDPVPVDRAHEIALDTLNEVIAATLGDREPLVSSRAAVQGRPGEVLAARGEAAQMLVVGADGARAPLGLRLGSVAAYCVHHAPCPVLVVRGRVAELGARADDAADAGSPRTRSAASSPSKPTG